MEIEKFGDKMTKAELNEQLENINNSLILIQKELKYLNESINEGFEEDKNIIENTMLTQCTGCGMNMSSKLLTYAGGLGWCDYCI